MTSRKFSGFVSAVLAQCVAMTMLVIGAGAAASTTKVIYNFAGGADGEYLDTDLVADNAGKLYGTTVQGGSGSGTVFQLALSASGWTHTVHSPAAQTEQNLTKALRSTLKAIFMAPRWLAAVALVRAVAA